MIKLSYEQIVEKIKEKSGLSEEEIEAKVNEKLEVLSGLISKDGAAHIIANELGVNVFEAVAGPLKLDKLVPGMRNVEVAGKVRAIYDLREFNTQKGAGKVRSFLIADDTGITRITCWNDQTEKMSGIKEDDVVVIKNGYVRENNGRSEVHLNDQSSIDINPEGLKIDAVAASVSAPQDYVRKKISELSENDFSAEILGTVVQVFEPRFFEICPRCGRRARQREEVFICNDHDVVEPDYSYVMNAIVDDGSETIRVVFFRDQAESFVGKAREEFLNFKQFPEKFEEVKIDLLGQIVKIGGRVSKNSMFDRLEFVAKVINTKPAAKEEIAQMSSNS